MTQQLIYEEIKTGRRVKLLWPIHEDDEIVSFKYDGKGAEQKLEVRWFDRHFNPVAE